MKKLLTIVAGLALAGMAQAASVDWTATALYTFDGTATASATAGSVYAYLFLDTDSANLEATMSSIATALAGGDRTAVTGFAQGKGNPGGNKLSAGSPIDGYAATTTYGQILFVNAATLDDATWFYTSNVKSAVLDDATATTMAFGSQKTAGMNNAGAWTEIAPEPTSGMMLLLGMGVLALRRRRA